MTRDRHHLGINSERNGIDTGLLYTLRRDWLLLEQACLALGLRRVPCMYGIPSVLVLY